MLRLTLFVLSFFLSFSNVILSSGRLGGWVAKNLPAISGKVGAKIGEKAAWPIAARFLGALSSYLLHIGELGTMFRKSVAQPVGKIALVGGMGSIVFFLFSLRQLRQKMHDLDQRIKEKENELQEEKAKIVLHEQKFKKPVESAEPQQVRDDDSESLFLVTKKLLETKKEQIERELEIVKNKRNDRVKLFFNIASPLSKVMLFALYGGMAYGLQYSGSLIEWIGKRGIDPAWGGKFVQ